MKKLYLDMNVYNRPLDDQSQPRVRLETIAILSILKAVKEKKFGLIWSFMHEYENSLNPFDDIRLEIALTSSLVSYQVHIHEDILQTAKKLEAAGIKPRDAMHFACAQRGKADFFLTCDDKLLKKAALTKQKIQVMNPVDFFRSEVK